MKRIKSMFLILILFLFPGGLIVAQEVNVTATVSSSTVTVDGQLQYAVEVSGKSTSLPDVRFPDFEDFYVLAGPNTSTSIQMVNGAITSSKTFSFILQPRREGRFTIKPASVKDNGKTVSSNAIEITVKKGSDTQAGRSNKKQKPKSSTDADIAGENLYLKTKVSKRNVFIGEQIIAEYKLYFKVNVRGYNIDRRPSSAGFWREDLKLPAQPNIEQEIVNGERYNVATLYKTALFPTQVGELTIDPMEVTLEALVRSQNRRRSIFDSFFDDPFGRTIQKKLASNPITVNVKPLPDEGKPEPFEGTVGNYNLNVSVDKRQAEVNEGISLKIRISGRGNIKMAELPELPIPPDIERYDPKISTNINNNSDYISGSKTAEYILVPRLEGTYEIKPIALSFFNPATKSYKTVRSEPIKLTISPASRPGLATDQQGRGFLRHEVAQLGKDIRFIKENSDFRKIGFRTYLSPSFWFSLLGALILFVGFLIIDDRQAKMLSDERLARSRRAGKIAAKHLSEAKAKLHGEKQSEFYKAVSLALQGFVRDKLNIEMTDFSVTNIQKALQDKGVSDDVITEYIKVLEESDFRQYANMGASESERKTLFEQARAVLVKMEKWM